MSLDLAKGLRKISEAQAARISHEVTEQALKALELKMSELEQVQA